MYIWMDSMAKADTKNLFWFFDNLLCNNVPLVAVKIIDRHYNEFYNYIVTVDEFEIFKNIMESDVYALLYMRDNKFGSCAMLKMNYRKRIPMIYTNKPT